MLNSFYYNATVVVVWLAAMSWLITTKVLPSFLVGNPPQADQILQAQMESPLVGWRMLWDGNELGWALNRTRTLPNDLTEVDTRVHFDRLPLHQIVPQPLQSLMGGDLDLVAQLALDVHNTLVYDPLNRVCRFETAVAFAPGLELIKLRGRADEGRLHIDVRYGQSLHEVETNLPSGMLFGESMSPQPSLPGLRLGQTWTVKVYSPFANPTNPTELLHAAVEGREPMAWNGRIVDAWIVVYRADPGNTSGRGGAVRGKLWVRSDGTVLKQQATLFGSKLSFVRLAEVESNRLETSSRSMLDEAP